MVSRMSKMAATCVVATTCTGLLAWPSIKVMRCSMSTESARTRAFRNKPLKEWTSYPTEFCQSIASSIKSKTHAVVVVDPTGEDLIEYVRKACSNDERRLVYVEESSDISKAVCSELSIFSTNDLHCFKEALLIVLENVDTKQYYKHVEALVDNVQGLSNIRVVVLTRDPHVAKLMAGRFSSKVLYDQSGSGTLCPDYIKYKLGANHEAQPNLEGIMLQSNSPGFVDYVCKTSTSATMQGTIQMGAESYATMYSNMRRSLA